MGRPPVCILAMVSKLAFEQFMLQNSANQSSLSSYCTCSVQHAMNMIIPVQSSKYTHNEAISTALNTPTVSVTIMTGVARKIFQQALSMLFL